MTTPDNPYRPPEAPLSELPEDGARPPAGDLERALSGDLKLDLGPVLKEAWRLVSGIKAITNLAVLLLSIPYFAGFVVIFAVFVGFDASLFTDPVALSAKMQGLATDPAYLLATSLGFLPINAIAYLSLWGMGLRRAAGHDVRLADAAPTHAWLPTMAVLLLVLPFGFLNLVHPLLVYLSVPVWFVLFWTLPMFVDRRDGVGVAIRQSLAIARHNWLPLLGLGIVMFAGYMASFFTCGIGFLWFVPFACTALGETWRQLAGLEQA